MKRYYRYIAYALLASSLGTSMISCSREDFAEYNTDPDAVMNPAIQPLFTQALTSVHDTDFEAFYDNYNFLSRWSRTFLQRTGNSVTLGENAANTNQRYSRFYTGVGPLLVDIQKMVDKMPEAEKARHIYIRTLPTIVKVYFAWYVSDTNGSIPYSEAFQARYGGTMTPKYDTQDELFATFDRELKEAVTILQTKQPVDQVSYGTSDIYFQGNITKWIKAANSLRLQIALRLSKRDPQRMATIVKEVLADKDGVINSAAEQWVFYPGARFTEGGNWNITGNGRAFVGDHDVVNYMWKNNDPRLRFFFVKNMWSEENFAAAKAQGKIPATAVFDQRRYYGQFSSPDSQKDPAKSRFFAPIQIKNGDANVTLDTVSRIQDRLFQPENNGGSGLGTMPIITYADICFIRAELAQRGVTSENAEEWYYKGIEASLRFYDDVAKRAVIYDYTALTDTEIENFKKQPSIVYSSAKGLEQIVMQSYLNFFRNFNEAWAIVKRTGMPNKNTAIAFEDWSVDNAPIEMPRRYVINYPLTGDYNYSNKQKAVEDMVKDPDFGAPTNISGRIWWDKK
ncbi:SusD/RagB family nutrient-binding outer membrane lipoprotein [Sphingobacterium psychroaquaticum]|uniref:Starch-binding associating with outer membrane n=1 Tax=Sphingobacterium psychroaquaticum TaxID=561061 RepID=A0A1X7K0P5_9SPHI|nr:SusD/RagB family nutrient-binding outer membrane lipoprotein [Sphingobacterium psychroaquaticum]QBQ42471.1 SusD/RagB family nutrient-binding outer membrane lipoprotein [Sphingobacterium psychroaquaticum]SMG34462.1 Starch-binding associating with outer membrane [Sphingobacterium psychroaquaticum]